MVISHFSVTLLSKLSHPISEKQILTILKETKIAEQEGNMGHYFGSVISSIRIWSSKCCLQPCIGLWYFDWLTSAGCFKNINFSQRSYTTLTSNWFEKKKTHFKVRGSCQELTTTQVIWNHKKEHILQCIVFELRWGGLWMFAQFPPLISSFAENMLDY